MKEVSILISLLSLFGCTGKQKDVELKPITSAAEARELTNKALIDQRLSDLRETEKWMRSKIKTQTFDGSYYTVLVFANDPWKRYCEIIKKLRQEGFDISSVSEKEAKEWAYNANALWSIDTDQDIYGIKVSWEKK